MLLLSDMMVLTPYAPPVVMGSLLMVEEDLRRGTSGVKELLEVLQPFCGRYIAQAAILYPDGADGMLYISAMGSQPHLNAHATRLRRLWLIKQKLPFEEFADTILGTAVAFKRKIWGL